MNLVLFQDTLGNSKHFFSPEAAARAVSVSHTFWPKRDAVTARLNDGRHRLIFSRTSPSQASLSLNLAFQVLVLRQFTEQNMTRGFIQL